MVTETRPVTATKASAQAPVQGLPSAPGPWPPAPVSWVVCPGPRGALGKMAD